MSPFLYYNPNGAGGRGCAWPCILALRQYNFQRDENQGPRGIGKGKLFIGVVSKASVFPICSTADMPEMAMGLQTDNNNEKFRLKTFAFRRDRLFPLHKHYVMNDFKYTRVLV